MTHAAPSFTIALGKQPEEGEVHEGLGINGDDVRGWRVLKLDADQANEGRIIYEYVGALEPEDVKYSSVFPDDLGKRWGEGTYLVIDLNGTFYKREANEHRVVMDEPSFSTYEEPEDEPDELTDDEKSKHAAAIAACPTPEFHRTHRYCPSCPWTEADGLPEDAIV